MPAYDLPLDELHHYRPPRQEPPDFDDFWNGTMAEMDEFPLEIDYSPVDFALPLLDTFDVTFSGWMGQPVKAWLILPHNVSEPLPCIIEFPSYGGGRGFPLDWLTFPCANFAYCVMDNRGQGSGWRHGDTPDIPSTTGNHPHSPGVMTLGILDPRTYYYRRLFIDAVRLCRLIMQHPAVDNKRVAVTGISQGGGVSLAVAALEPSINAVLPEAPFLSCFQRATQLVDTPPYNEINNYCQIHRDHIDRVFRTLSYFDVTNFAARCTEPALFSIGLMDMISPPSTVFAAYNWYAGNKEIKVWQYNGHEGGGTFHQIEKIRFLNRLWGR